jgi:hypothetical protein
MDQIIDTGSTMKFIQPSFSVGPINPWSIDFNTASLSDYHTKYFLYRNDTSIVSIIDTPNRTFPDLCVPANKRSISNGQTYAYALYSVNTVSKLRIAANQTLNASTYPVNFTASKRTENGIVNLSWNTFITLTDHMDHLMEKLHMKF